MSERRLWKIKLGILTLGILLLGVVLSLKGRGKTESREPGTAREETEEKVDDTEAKTAEIGQQQEPLPFTGKIRVLLKTDQFAELLQKQVVLLSETGEDFTAVDRDTGEVLETGSRLEVSLEDGVLFLNGEPVAEQPACIRIEEQAEGLQVASLTRQQGHPVYAGALELWPAEDGFYLVNELPLEEYLKDVVPSEMPSGYNAEALKAQAVCARTYAYQELDNYTYPECEAHVDDSVSFQVYGNTGRAESTDRAVEETAGQILTCGGKPITAYYFSTSFGATGNQEVWWDGDAAETPYLAGKTVDPEGRVVDLSSAEAFHAFLEQENPACYDAGMGWYRWETEPDNQTLSEHLNQALAGRIAANPDAIQVRLGKRLESRNIKSIGRIRGIDVLERNAGGAITRLRIRGSRHTIEVATEYNVRALLNVQGEPIRKKDGSKAEGGALLPSACMEITPVFDAEGELDGWHFSGGGLGHGVGLSQNGANGMAKQGKTCAEILHFFYTDVELTALDTL